MLRNNNKYLDDPAIIDALNALQSGAPILIHDFSDRESETDLIYPAYAVDETDVVRMRNDAGGLLCVALSYEVAESFDLPFLAEELTHPATDSDHLGYDERSSFSISVNHRDTYTGVTDADRALTISKLGKAADNPENVDFAAEFRSPGHVHLLKAADGLLKERKGHTELAITLTKAADIPPAAAVCEMLDDKSGHALSKSQARSYASRHDMPFIEGSQIMNALD